MAGELHLTLRAVPAEIPIARSAITELCERLRVATEVTERVRVATTEACTNCVLHAYDGHDPSSTYSLEARVEDDALLVVVHDSGAGIPDHSERTAASGLGLGLPLMRGMASHLDVASSAHTGTRVEMRFALRAGRAPSAADA